MTIKFDDVEFDSDEIKEALIEGYHLWGERFELNFILESVSDDFKSGVITNGSIKDTININRDRLCEFIDAMTEEIGYIVDRYDNASFVDRESNMYTINDLSRHIRCMTLMIKLGIYHGNH